MGEVNHKCADCPGCKFIMGMLLGAGVVLGGRAIWLLIEWVRYL